MCDSEPTTISFYLILSYYFILAVIFPLLRELRSNNSQQIKMIGLTVSCTSPNT